MMFDELKRRVEAAIEEAANVSYAAGSELAEALDDLTRAGNDIINILVAEGSEDA